MNKKQKIIFAIFIPIIIFFITLMIANLVGITVTHHLGFSIDTKDETGKILKIPKFYKSGINYDTHRHEPFKWEKTWYVWLLALISCCIFEYKLFADKKRKISN